MQKISGKKILILATNGFEQAELEVPRDRLKAGLVQPGPDQAPRKYNPVNLGDYL